MDCSARRRTAIRIALLLWPLTAHAQAQPATLRYDLKPGDHVVFRQRLDRHLVSEDGEQRAVAEWTTHLLATEPCPGCVVVGFQRNRTAARLVMAKEAGRDTTTASQKDFAAQLQSRRGVFAEANWIDPAGRGLLPWAVSREWRSLLLPFLHEVEPLPDGPVAPGQTWAGGSAVRWRMTASACPDSPGADCVLLQGQADAGRLRVWFSRSEGLATKIVVQADYASGPGTRSHEELTFELVERRRGERTEQWLESSETREGALAALQVSATRLVQADRLYRLLDQDDAEVQRRALAAAWRWRLAPPEVATLEHLLSSPSPRVRTLAARMAGHLPRQSGSALLDQASKDPDSFVREAATSDNTGTTGTCEAAVDRWKAGRRFEWQPPGVTVRAMTTPGLEGWPFVVRVPDDYSADHPVPVLVYLSGGSGIAAQAAQSSEAVLADTGYLAVFPHAGGLWWESRPREMVRALLGEVLRGFNVDTNRVFLAGFSNGGTGALLYGSLWPDRFAAIVPTMASAVGDGNMPAFVSGLDSVPLLLIHGAKDTVIPASETRENQRRLSAEARTSPLQVELLDGRPHDVTIGSDEGRTLRFIEGRRRDPFPPTVVAEMSDLSHPRRYWVEIAEKTDGVARVHARVTPEGAIEITTKNVRRLRLLLRRELLPPEGPLVVRVNGREAFRGAVSEDCQLFARTLEELSDPWLAYSAAIDLAVTR